MFKYFRQRNFLAKKLFDKRQRPDTFIELTSLDSWSRRSWAQQSLKKSLEIQLVTEKNIYKTPCSVHSKDELLRYTVL